MSTSTEATAVQIVIRGQRFQSSVGILSSSCATFRTFFTAATAQGNIDKDSTTALLHQIVQENYNSHNATSATHVVPVRSAVLSTEQQPSSWCLDFTVRKDENPTEEMLAAELQPEFAGALFVLMRKMHAAGLVNGDGSDSHVTLEQCREKGIKWASRWSEMGYEQQRCLADLVTAFGFEMMLREGYGKPTAEPAVSVVEEGDGPKGTTELAMQYAAAKQREAIMADDLLEMPAQGCAKCGTSGHATESCPY